MAKRAGKWVVKQDPSSRLWHALCDLDPITAAGRTVQPQARYSDAVAQLTRAWQDAGAPIPVGDAEITMQPWTSPIAWVEGEETVDKRKIVVDAVKSQTPPLPFFVLDHQNAWGHKEAVVCGRIDSVSVTADPLVAGQQVGTLSGVYSNDQWGERGYQMALTGTGRGISVDLSACTVEYEWPPFPEDDPDWDPDDPWDLMDWEWMNYPTEVFTYAELAGATQCTFPAFVRAYVQVDGATFDPPGRPAGVPDEAEVPWDDALAAAGGREQITLSLTTAREQGALWHMTTIPPRLRSITAGAQPAGTDLHPTPTRPPLEWFTDPHLDGPTPLTITEDGHVFGHAATWDVEHIGMPGTGRTAPHSQTNYAHFRTGNVLTAEGDLVATGPLTIDGGHADLQLGLRDAQRVYDDTTTSWADTAAGEDRWGIWVNGCVRSGTTYATVNSARASSISGDWRPADTDGDGRADNLEAVAFLCVNTPGFPIPRVLAAGGQMLALVAAGSGTLARMRRASTVSAETQAAIDRAVKPLAASLASAEKALRPTVVEQTRARVHAGR